MLPNKLYEWSLVSRALTGSFHVYQGVWDQHQHPVMHTHSQAAKKPLESRFSHLIPLKVNQANTTVRGPHTFLNKQTATVT